MFGGLFGGKKKGAAGAQEIQKLSPAVSSAIFGSVGARGIPTMPGAAQKAFKLAVDPTAEARDFIDVIESDEALTARILKIANSVFFDRGKHSNTIEEAVVVIGINELRCLLNATSLSELFPTSNPVRQFAWSNDIATALIARALTQRLVPAAAEIAFLGGLMHDIGKLLLIQRASDGYSKVVKAVESEGTEFFRAEGEIFPFDHTEAGQLIGEKWNFTPELIEMIRHHHRSFSEISSEGTSPPLFAIVKCSDIIAHALGLGHPKGFAKLRAAFERQLDEAWEFLKISPSERKDLQTRFQKTYDVEYELYSGKGFK